MMVERSKIKSGAMSEALARAIEKHDPKELVEELKKLAPPLEVLADEEVEEIEKATRVLAAKAESYYLGYLRGQVGPGGEVADAGVTIIAATTGSVVGTVVGQIVGKKLDKAVNLREQVINPEMFKFEDLQRLDK